MHPVNVKCSISTCLQTQPTSLDLQQTMDDSPEYQDEAMQDDYAEEDEDEDEVPPGNAYRRQDSGMEVDPSKGGDLAQKESGEWSAWEVGVPVLSVLNQVTMRRRKMRKSLLTSGRKPAGLS